MAGYDDQADDSYYLDEPAGSFEQDLVYALDAGVRHTVNQALAQAIKPIKHHLLGFAEQQGWVAPSGLQPLMDPSLSAGTQADKQSNNPHAADFQTLIRNMARDHDYNSPKNVASDPASSASSDHSSEHEDDLPHKRRKKAHHQEAPAPKVLTFEPEDIVHPRSSLWLPPPEVADYVESHIRHSFDKEVRSRLRSECPRPDFPSKVTDTPELDATLVTFLKKSAKDPKKGIDRAWRGCQDKLLDVTGPLTKILALAFQAKESGDSINPDVLAGWAQRALCFLGILMKLDPKLADLATSESGPVAQGLLFGAPFLKELSKFVATYASLDKAQGSIRRVLHPLFSGACRYRGRAFGRFYQQGSQCGFYHQGRGGFQEYDSSSSMFYPSRPRASRSRFRRGRAKGHQSLSHEAGSSAAVLSPASQKSTYSALPEDSNCKVELAMTSDNRTIVCYHPTVDIPFEHTKPIPRPDPVHSLEETHELVLKARLDQEVTENKQGPTIEQLSKMFYTTKHRWYPVGQYRRRRINTNPPKDR